MKKGFGLPNNAGPEEGEEQGEEQGLVRDGSVSVLRVRFNRAVSNL